MQQVDWAASAHIFDKGCDSSHHQLQSDQGYPHMVAPRTYSSAGKRKGAQAAAPAADCHGFCLVRALRHTLKSTVGGKDNRARGRIVMISAMALERMACIAVPLANKPKRNPVESPICSLSEKAVWHLFWSRDAKQGQQLAKKRSMARCHARPA